MDNGINNRSNRIHGVDFKQLEEDEICSDSLKTTDINNKNKMKQA